MTNLVGNRQQGDKPAHLSLFWYYHTWYTFLSDSEKSLQKRSLNSFKISFKLPNYPRRSTWLSLRWFVTAKQFQVFKSFQN